MDNMEQSVFQRCGLATLSDLKGSACQSIFSQLEEEQEAFLKKQPEFLSDDYKWPRDSLHTWSRIWEYPYVYHHLKKQVEALGPDSDLKVADLGSAVTFFPFSVAKLGCRVHCLDIDPTCGPDIERAANVVPHSPGKIDFNLISEGRLPLKDGEVDAVYCVSVLEHIPNFENTIEEVFRILKPNGLFVLTIDLDLCGHMDIDINGYFRLRQALAKRFDLKEPEYTVHPLDMLSLRNSPVSQRAYPALRRWKFQATQQMRQLLGKEYIPTLPDLAAWGAVMTKVSDESAGKAD